MTDGHIHIERGPYTLDWIQKFVDKAVEMGLSDGALTLLLLAWRKNCFKF